MLLSATCRWIIAIGFLMVSVSSGTAEVEQKTGLSMYVARKLGAVWPYQAEQRWELI